MKKILKNSSGITLVALVITIIILLILAGITITAIGGKEGIFNIAKESTDKSIEETAIEEIKLLVYEIQMESQGKVTLQQIVKKLEEDRKNTYIVTTKTQISSLTTQGGLGITDVSEITDETEAIYVTNTKYGYEVKVTSSLNVSSSTITENKKEENSGVKLTSITPENYGDYVKYNVDLGIDGDQDGDTTDIDDWRIFYNDGSNVYLIAADYLPNTLLPTETDMGTDAKSPYSALWPSTSYLTRAGMADVSESVANKYMLSWRTAYTTNAGHSAKAVAALLDTNAWASFAEGIEGAEAVGGPTLEMYVASWNAKNYTQLYCNNLSAAGYYIGTTDMPTDVSVSVSTIGTGYADTLYYPHKEKYEGCQGYWLSSPAATNAIVKCTMIVHCDGSLVGSTTASAAGWIPGVRPLVSLPSDVVGIQDENGVWHISK